MKIYTFKKHSKVTNLVMFQFVDDKIYVSSCLHYMDFRNRGMFIPDTKTAPKNYEEECLKLILHKWYGYNSPIIDRYDTCVMVTTR